MMYRFPLSDVYLESTAKEIIIAVDAARVIARVLFNQVPHPRIPRARIWAQWRERKLADGAKLYFCATIALVAIGGTG